MKPDDEIVYFLGDFSTINHLHPNIVKLTEEMVLPADLVNAHPQDVTYWETRLAWGSLWKDRPLPASRTIPGEVRGA